MKKLKLNLKDLKVESFETTKKKRKKKGTVMGYITGLNGPKPCTFNDNSCLTVCG